ncbi:MAG: S8 family peptidase [Oscillospiraceae bacterium]|jgi:subtilisin family serine protease|nr:S8 family peptidase [Oscillospiraceae bacterium]
MSNGTNSLEDFIYRDDTAAIVIKSEMLPEELFSQHPYIHPGKSLTGGYTVVYVNVGDIEKVVSDTENYVSNIFPLVMGLLDTSSLDAAGILQVERQPWLGLRGNGVLLGFVDTGIDYTNNAFLYEDGTSKIRYIWDQTIPGSAPDGYFFGSEYTNERLNEALLSEDPFSVVPHRDTVGHGTFLASVAGGREPGEYIGAAPEAEIIAVKLKEARRADYARFLIPPEQKNAFASDDFALGIQYIVDKALELKKPVAICISLGTNYGSHNGFTELDEYLSDIAGITGVSISAAVGNEGQSGHHAQGKFNAQGETQDLELRVGEKPEDVYMSIWNYSMDRLSVEITSPSGEHINRIPARSGITYRNKLVLERSTVVIEYVFPIQRSGEQLTRIKIYSATPGIWTITLHGDIILDGGWHAWLPLTGFISPGTVFLSPSPNYTVVTPATTLGITACGAYDHRNDSLAPSTSWGPTRMPSISPDLVAPGVEVGGSYPTGHGTMSGTSVAAAITAGASALMLQWGIVEGNDVSLDSFRVRARLVAGCERSEDVEFPNNRWGYGKLNLLNAFQSMRPV